MYIANLSIQLNDLPDEILILILKKLNNADVLYSFIGVNKRLDRIAKDSIFTRCLTLETLDRSKRFTDTMINRLCLQILPNIHDNIESFILHSSYMKQILLATYYPNLRGLSLYHLESETARDLFIDGSFLIQIYKNQLSSLVIHIDQCQEESSSINDINLFLYRQIISRFINLQNFNFHPYACTYYHRLTFGLSPPNMFSSTLLQLRVLVDSYDDCLCLLDGCFNQLNTFYVTIYSSDVSSSSAINNKTKLFNLKCFQLILNSRLLIYNTFLIPLLHRMSNLEELDLNFINENQFIIDGHNLQENIMNYMRKLKKFKFNVRSVIPLNNQVNLPSNDDIQNTFTNFKNTKIISSIDSFPKGNELHCRIYSYPYTWMSYGIITNNFCGGLFESVLKISLVDERPFEHEFFLRIAQSFPSLSELRVQNGEPQKNDNQQWSIIEYPQLIQIDLLGSHENYVEQFLNNTKMQLLNNIYLWVDYDTLQRATDNFRSAVTRLNCSKIKCLVVSNKPDPCQDLRDYFPHAEVL